MKITWQNLQGEYTYYEETAKECYASAPHIIKNKDHLEWKQQLEVDGYQLSESMDFYG